MTYDFTTLSPDDFEILVADLLSTEWGMRLETFKPGKDGGIDLRNTRMGPGGTLVQCKRYAPHKFAELLRAVKSEKAKIAKRKPSRYVLATSVPLSPGNKDEIFAALRPWCKSLDDIYSASDLNGLVRKYPEVEKAHFKLWIASTTVLERILHSQIFNITQATVESTKAQLSRIVMHPGFDRALALLHQEHHVLIVGNPGIGKTTLARILLCHYLREGFEPICVMGNIDDAWKVIHEPGIANRKIVILYDDFLGRVRFDSPRFEKNEEFSLLEFIARVRRSPNLRFVFTTREYILADAQRIHGAFASRVDSILKFTLKLQDYSDVHRAKMLFNHLYFSDLPDSRLAALVRHRVYRNIVEHEYFNPRMVESISAYANTRAMTDEEYLIFIQGEFDNPAKVWGHPFRSDISPLARTILTVLWTFGGTAEIESLKAAVKRISSTLEANEFAIQFTEGLHQLDGNFISTSRYPGKSGDRLFHVVEFSNPSVEEFIDNFLLADTTLAETLVRSVVVFRQVSEIAANGARDKKSGTFSKLFWVSLRDVAAIAEDRPGGYLINYHPYGESSRRTWDEGERDLPRQTIVRLRIELQRSLDDRLSRDLKDRVCTADGWLSLLRGLQNDNTHAYGVKQVHEWIEKESSWDGDVKARCYAAYRDGFFEFIQDEDEVWACPLDALRVLVEALVKDGISWTDREKAAFHAACKLAAGTIVDNARAADDVRNEADELVKIERISGLNFKSEIAGLEGCANDLSERSTGEEPSDPESAYVSKSEPDNDFDMDALFAGLLDR